MGEFGWAYVAGGAITGALGPTGSVLLKIGHLEISGSSKLIFNTANDTLEINGHLSASNTLTASNLYLPDVASGTATTSSYLALDSNKKLVLTSSSGVSTTSYSRTAVTSTVTASVSSKILGVSASSGIDIRLPSAASYVAGQNFIVKDEGGNSNVNNITIRTSGSQTIDGNNSIVLESPYAAVNIYSDGTSKFFIY